MKHIAITENHLYSKTYAKGQKFVGGNTVLYVLKDLRSEKLMRANPMKEYVNRVGLTVSKKLGGAVERNRVKRILREGLRQTEQDLNLKKGYLIVIVARSGAVNAKSDQIKRELTKGFRSLNMIENKQ